MPKDAVLVIDDEKDLVELLRYNLEKEGYRVFSAETGEAGFRLARTERPAAVLLDLMLPSTDGLEVCRLLKSDPVTRNIPVIMLTAKGTDVDQVVGLEVGASDYVTKPFSVKVLLVRLKNVLKNAAGAADEPNVLRCRELALDLEKHVLSVKGKRVPLTKTELALLAALMQRPEFVVSRQTLTAAAWGPSAVVSEAALNMQIKGLRDKLGDFRARLQTVRGSGFRLS